MKKFLIYLIVIIFTGILQADYQDIPVTRDIELQGNYDDLEKYAESHPFQPTEYHEIYRSANSGREGESILIVVQSDLYPAIQTSIDTYINDLENENNDVFLLEFSGTSAFDLKLSIMIYYQQNQITGTVLIGDLPFAVFEMFEDFNNNGIWDPDENWVSFPCDLYFTDIDGNWEDDDNNGAFEVHTGDVHPEIFSGRIKADNLYLLADSEAELINSYFDRNHLYRNGLIYFPSNALAYIDDDWHEWGDELQDALQLLYPDTELVEEINATTAMDYRDIRLHQNYEFIQVHVHSGPEAHFFYEDNGNIYNLVTNGEIATQLPDALFYNLFACSNSRFTFANNMGALYIYGNETCFATIGSTKTGSMLSFEDFYQPLADGENMGNALRLWWEQNVDVSNDWMWERSWFYGMVIQGDPTLQLQQTQNIVINIPDDYPTIQQGIDAAEDGDIVLVQPGTYEENINFNGKNILVTSEFYTTQDTSYIYQTIIDGGHSDTVVKFESDETSSAKLIGFTITNGLYQYTSGGGGITIINNSCPTLQHLIIINNYSHDGAGIYCKDSYPILSDLTISYNQVPNSSSRGGGIFLMNCYSYLTIKNSIFRNNLSGNSGSAISCLACFEVKLENVIITDNESGYMGDGSIFLHDSNAVIMNSVIFGNIDLNGGAGIAGNGDVIILNSIIYNNPEPQLQAENTVMYSLIEGGFPGIGNINTNPLFIHPLEYDFHLQDTSPCIGEGIDEIEINGNWYYAPELDLEGNPRPNPSGSMPDMGVYENPLGAPQTEVDDHVLSTGNFELSNYPNPFNPSTTISFSQTPEITENIEVAIYNLKGQKVKSFDFAQDDNNGIYSVVWNGTDENGKQVTSGIYFYKLKADNFQKTKKMLLMK